MVTHSQKGRTGGIVQYGKRTKTAISTHPMTGKIHFDSGDHPRTGTGGNLHDDFTDLPVPIHSCIKHYSHTNSLTKFLSLSYLPVVGHYHIILYEVAYQKS